MAEVFRQFMHAQEQQEQRYLQALQTLQVTMQQAIQPASSSLGLESPRMELPTPAPRRISLSPRVPHTPTVAIALREQVIGDCAVSTAIVSRIESSLAHQWEFTLKPSANTKPEKI
ncbi:hypothetical protein HF521_015481 [Silurus meridionalis]|uniref:Uncharacterized protein n=1 Tax=Silurus meridionalis TaxID=175797 RepID=A0A8T0A558_SILME|nr:hypothetical protein HF521_015481 [Silurus meridionalis]